MPWIDENTHVTLGPSAAGMEPDELQAHIDELKARAKKMHAEREAASTALQGLPYAAVPLDQLADIYKRFLRLLRLGSLPLDEWNGMPENEVEVRRAVFRQADFGAVFAGQWLPRELREEIRNLVKGKRYDHNFDQHEVAYHRDRMDRMVQRS
jgi:hypothetical protein